MEKVRPWCGQPSDRRRLKNRTEQSTHTHTHPFNGPLPRTTRVRRYEKGKTNVDFNEARDIEWHWHQLSHMQVCISLQIDNHASAPPLSFFTGRMPFLPPNQQRQSTEGKSTEGKIDSCSSRFQLGSHQLRPSTAKRATWRGSLRVPWTTACNEWEWAWPVEANGGRSEVDHPSTVALYYCKLWFCYWRVATRYKCHF